MNLFIIALFFSIDAQSALTIDKSETLNGVLVTSGKAAGVRVYTGKIGKTYNYPFEKIKSAVTNFTEKCNNDFRDKRRYTSESYKCRYHNDNLIETVVIRSIKTGTLRNFTEAYLLARQVYNRSTFAYYELVTVQETKNAKNHRSAVINLRMLTDDEARSLTEPKFKRESVFDKSSSMFTLTEISDSQTKVEYEYSAETGHWLLNKEISVPQVFDSISKSINTLMGTIEEGAGSRTAEHASR